MFGEAALILFCIGYAASLPCQTGTEIIKPKIIITVPGHHTITCDKNTPHDKECAPEVSDIQITIDLNSLKADTNVDIHTSQPPNSDKMDKTRRVDPTGMHIGDNPVQSPNTMGTTTMPNMISPTTATTSSVPSKPSITTPSSPGLNTISTKSPPITIPPSLNTAPTQSFQITTKSPSTTMQSLPTRTNSPPNKTQSAPSTVLPPLTTAESRPIATKSPPTTTLSPPTSTVRPTTSKPPSHVSQSPPNTKKPPTNTSKSPSNTSKPPSNTSKPPSNTSKPSSNERQDPPNTKKSPPDEIKSTQTGSVASTDITHADASRRCPQGRYFLHLHGVKACVSLTDLLTFIVKEQTLD